MLAEVSVELYPFFVGQWLSERWNVAWRVPYVRCLLYTSDAADERSSGEFGGRRIIKKKNKKAIREREED